MTNTIVLVGTRKGLWIGRSDERRRDWTWTGPEFDMTEVYACMVDQRGGRQRLLAGTSSPWTGPRITVSDDLGETWRETKGVHFGPSYDASVERIWQLAPGTGDDQVYAGTEPGAVFRSDDGGETFDLVEGLWNHPHRTQWGAGYGGQAFHTIVAHPTDPDSMIAAISSGGAYRTRDGGDTWEPCNAGVQAEFLPEDQQYPEFGQCVHKIARHPSAPDRLFLQNHGGVYRSEDYGDSWQSIEDGLPARFGFAMVVHPHEPETIYTFPLVGSGQRYPVDAVARVWRSKDAGDTWQALGGGASDGLPDNFFVGVMRDAMCTDDHGTAGIYFGARNGAVHASPDAGETWTELISGLPDVMVVRAAAV